MHGRGREITRSIGSGYSTCFAGHAWRKFVPNPRQFNRSTPFPCSLPFSLFLLHSLYYRLPGMTLSPSGDHQLASTSRSRSTRSETAHETHDTRPESSGPSAFTRAQQLSQSPEIIQKGLVMEGADLRSDYKAVRINADLPVLHTGSENTSPRRRTPSR